MAITVKSESVAEVTPAMLAEIFWNMCSDEQAEFFHELHRVTTEAHESNPNAYGLGELQWCYMTGDIKKRSREAYEMYLAFCAFAFDYWPRKEISA